MNVPFSEIETVFADSKTRKTKKNQHDVMFYQAKIAGMLVYSGNACEWKTLGGLLNNIRWKIYSFASRADRTIYYSNLTAAPIPAVPALVDIYKKGGGITDINNKFRAVIKDQILQGNIVLFQRRWNDVNGWYPVDLKTIDWKKLKMA